MGQKVSSMKKSLASRHFAPQPHPIQTRALTHTSVIKLTVHNLACMPLASINMSHFRFETHGGDYEEYYLLGCAAV
jgi:hypothetical protein